MKRENAVRRRLHSFETLSEAVGAMKSLAAHHFRSARSAIAAARAYRNGVDEVIAALGLHQRPSPGEASAILLLAADLGLCGAYNSQLSAAALHHFNRLSATRFYCVGHRPLPSLRRSGVSVDRQYHAPTSVAGLTELLLVLGEDLLVDFLENRFASLDVVSARFEGVGKFSTVCSRLLPIVPPEIPSQLRPSTYVSPDHLAAVAIREYLYINLFQLSLDSLACEHGARLIATEAAGRWLDEKTEVAKRQLGAIRRESSTQEVLDLCTTSQRRKVAL